MAEKTEKNLPVTLAVWGIPLIIFVSYFILASSADLRLDQARLLVSAGIIVISLASVLALFESRPRLWSPAFILITACAIRLLFLFRPPELSDDIYRYLWDGFQLLRGRNPYALAPSEASSLMPDLSPLSSHINHPWLVTIYPPAAEILFALAAVLGGTLTSLKALLVLLDLAFCALLLRWLPRFDLPADRAVLYAWHPLPVLEIAGSGHVDGAGLLFLFLAFALLSAAPYKRVYKTPHPSPPRRRGSRKTRRPLDSRLRGNDEKILFTFFCARALSTANRSCSQIRPLSGKLAILAAGILFALAAQTKLFPLIYLPFLIVLLRGHGLSSFLSGFAATFALLIVPFLPDLLNGLETLRIFARTWESTGFLYRVLLGMNLPATPARLVLGGVLLGAVAFCTAFLLQQTKRIAGEGGFLPSQYAPGRCGLAADATARFKLVLVCCGGTSLAFLLLTPNLQPWYALWLVAFLPFAAEPAGIVLSWSVFLAYHPLIPYALLSRWDEEPMARAAVWCAPAAALMLRGLCLYSRSQRHS